MTSSNEKIREESLWFGMSERPLFGRLAMPPGGTAKGAVMFSPPIGRESRLARRALRSLAIYLARDGYVSLRYDHFGTGDSAGSLDRDFDVAWSEGVFHGIELLRSLGIESISAVGMRLGATIVGAAASGRNLGLSSLVLWDPCESGRNYVRELATLGAMRQHVLADDLRDSTTLLEYPLDDAAARRISRLTLIGAAVHELANRVLIVTRDDRTPSRNFRRHYQSDAVEWLTTSEQGPLLETELPSSVLPSLAITQIRAWLTRQELPSLPLSSPTFRRDAVVIEGTDTFSVRESVVELGSQRLFGIVSEPVTGARGPVVIMVNGINEDHVGPSRLWVEQSRRWASAGLRCLRFDPHEFGESGWSPETPVRSPFDKSLRFDVREVIRAISPLDPSDLVLIGLCSGAQLALESGLEFGFRELCAINPQVGFPEVHVAEPGEPGREPAHPVETYRNQLMKRYQAVGKGVDLFSRLVNPSAFSPQVKSKLAQKNSRILLLLSPNDPSPFSVIPIIGSLFGRRLMSSEHIQVKTIPALDHDFLSTLGRARAIAILDRYVRDTYSDHGEASVSHLSTHDAP